MTPGIFAVQYDCDSDACECFCQSSCDCMADVEETSTLFKIGNVASASVCSWSNAIKDDDAIEGEYYYCTCGDTITDEATCASTLGAGKNSPPSPMRPFPVHVCV